MDCCARNYVFPLIKVHILKKKIKPVAYSSQGSHTGELDFCNWLAVQRDNVITITLREVY